LLREAEDDRRLRRLGFVKNLYQGDSIPEAADREGRSAATGDRWAEAWNEGGLEALMPSFGGGRPPKLDEDEQKELIEMLREGQPWKSQEIQHLLQEEFGVSYSSNYLGTFLRELGLSYAKPRPKRPHRPENPDEILKERVDDALDEDEQPHNKREGEDQEGWTVNDNICTDGGTVLGFFDASKPQPYDNSRRVWYVDDPHIERELVKTHDSAVGFYALNGESLVTFTEDEKKERISWRRSRGRSRHSGLWRRSTTSKKTKRRWKRLLNAMDTLLASSHAGLTDSNGSPTSRSRRLSTTNTVLGGRLSSLTNSMSGSSRHSTTHPKKLD